MSVKIRKGLFPFFKRRSEAGIQYGRIYWSCCFKDETNNYADQVLGKLTGATAVVPCIWPMEVVNVFLAAERQKRLSVSDSIRFLTLLAQLPIVVEHERPETMQELLALGRTNNLPAMRPHI